MGMSRLQTFWRAAFWFGVIALCGVSLVPQQDLPQTGVLDKWNACCRLFRGDGGELSGLLESATVIGNRDQYWPRCPRRGLGDSARFAARSNHEPDGRISECGWSSSCDNCVSNRGKTIAPLPGRWFVVFKSGRLGFTYQLGSREST